MVNVTFPPSDYQHQNINPNVSDSSCLAVPPWLILATRKLPFHMLLVLTMLADQALCPNALGSQRVFKFMLKVYLGHSL